MGFPFQGGCHYPLGGFFNSPSRGEWLLKVRIRQSLSSRLRIDAASLLCYLKSARRFPGGAGWSACDSRLGMALSVNEYLIKRPEGT